MRQGRRRRSVGRVAARSCGTASHTHEVTRPPEDRGRRFDWHAYPIGGIGKSVEQHRSPLCRAGGKCRRARWNLIRSCRPQAPDHAEDDDHQRGEDQHRVGERSAARLAMLGARGGTWVMCGRRSPRSGVARIPPWSALVEAWSSLTKRSSRIDQALGALKMIIDCRPSRAGYGEAVTPTMHCRSPPARLAEARDRSR